MKALRRLLLACRGENGGSKPVGFCFARGVDCGPDGFCFIWRQSDRKDIDRSAFCREPRAPHFLLHTKVPFRVRKCLTRFWTFVYKRQVSNETGLSSERMAGTAAGESELTNSQPVRAGASRRESEMNAETLQAGTSDRRARFLKIEEIGDFSRGRIIPRLRIAGRWFERAGFKPGHRVEVLIAQPGCLTLRFVELGKEAAL